MWPCWTGDVIWMAPTLPVYASPMMDSVWHQEEVSLALCYICRFFLESHMYSKHANLGKYRMPCLYDFMFKNNGLLVQICIPSHVFRSKTQNSHRLKVFRWYLVIVCCESWLAYILSVFCCPNRQFNEAGLILRRLNPRP